MKRFQAIAGLGLSVGLLGLLALGCQKQTAGQDVTSYQQQRAAIIEKQRKAAAKPSQLAKGAEPAEHGDTFGVTDNRYVYDPIGKRDPFRSFILDRIKELDADAKSPLQQFDLSQLEVTGVVWEAKQRRALLLDPSGQNYIVQEGDPIGKNDGQVISIGDSNVVVREAYVDFHGERTTKEIEMKIRQSQGG